MAVPSSGSISLAGLAAEKDVDDYTDVDYDDRISLRDITLGGNTNSHITFDVTNAISPSHPDNDAAYAMSEFYSYDHDFAAPGCNIAYYEGNQGTFNYPINLGSAQGTVKIEYQAFSKPDAFTFTWNGNTYRSGHDSGGDPGWIRFVGNSSWQSTLNAALGYDSNVTSISVQTGTYGSGQNAQQGGRGTISFNKNAATGIANMKVEAPLSGTAWWFSVSCPGQQVIIDNSNSVGIAPSLTLTCSSISTSGDNRITMTGNVTNKGKTSNWTTDGTISAKGFIMKQNTFSTTPFYLGDSGVVHYPEDDSTINATGNFTEIASSVPDNLTPTITTNDASSITESSFTGSVTKNALPSRWNCVRAYATNAAGTTYTSNFNIKSYGNIDETGIVYCNQGYSLTPIASLDGGVLDDSTGCQYTQLQGQSGSLGTVTGTINESSVSLTASNTYRYRSVSRCESTITHGSIKTFTVSASADYTATLTTGWSTFYTTTGKGYYNGYPFNMGSLSNTSFNNGTIQAMYYNDGSSTDWTYIVFSGTKKSWTAMSINGQDVGASSTWTSTSNSTWRKNISTNLFGSSGSSISITASY